MLKKPKISMHRIVNDYFNKYQSLFFDLAHLSESVKEKLKVQHIRYPDPLENMIIGFREFSSPSLLVIPSIPRHLNQLPGDKTKKLYDFFIFIYILGTVLDNCKDENKNYLLKRFRTVCRSKNKKIDYIFRHLRGFYCEIKTFFFFFSCDFKLEHLPEQDNLEAGISPSDAIFCKQDQKFQVECQSISGQAGHPITSNEESSFFNLLSISSLYCEIYPQNEEACVEFIFNKKLCQKEYRAEDLMEDIKKKSKEIQLLKSNNVRILHEDEARQKRSRTISINQKTKHQVILHSRCPNVLDNSLDEAIAQKLEKKRKKGISIPVIYSFELYGPSTNGDYSIMHLFSEEVGLCFDSLEPKNIYSIPWGKILLRDLIKRKIVLRSNDTKYNM